MNYKPDRKENVRQEFQEREDMSAGQPSSGLPSVPSAEKAAVQRPSDAAWKPPSRAQILELEKLAKKAVSIVLDLSSRVRETGKLLEALQAEAQTPGG